LKNRAQIHFLPDGRRLHLHDGPIDIVLEAFGPPTEIEAAYRAAADRFVTVLDELCAELPNLRTPAGPRAPQTHRPVAQRMVAAVAPLTVGSLLPWRPSLVQWQKKSWQQ
jgi:ApbE superfamily uncharacterized protein (UPF0280 family)